MFLISKGQLIVGTSLRAVLGISNTTAQSRANCESTVKTAGNPEEAAEYKRW